MGIFNRCVQFLSFSVGYTFYVFQALSYSVKVGLLLLQSTVEPVYIEHSREMKKCSMYPGSE